MSEVSKIDNAMQTKTLLQQRRVALEARRSHKKLKSYLDWAWPAGQSGNMEIKGVLSPETPHAVTKAKKLLELVPCRQILEGTAEQFKFAIDNKANPQDIKILILLLVDSYPNASVPNLIVYVDQLQYAADEERGISTQVLADAIEELTVSQKFTPTVSELIDACDASEAKFKFALKQLERLLKHFEAAVDVLSNDNQFDFLDKYDPIISDWEQLG